MKLTLLPEPPSGGQTSAGPGTPCESRLAEVSGRLLLTVSAQTSDSRCRGQRGGMWPPGTWQAPSSSSDAREPVTRQLGLSGRPQQRVQELPHRVIFGL